MKSRRIELDILRILAAFCIVFFHYEFRGYAKSNMSFLFFPYLKEISKYGYFAIYTFFMLSAFSMTLTIENKNSGVKFLYSRIKRLYPTFWVSVGITSAFIIFLGGGKFSVTPKQFLINLTMLNGFVGVKSVDGVYWFLFVMLRFYFLYSLLIFFKLTKHLEYIVLLWILLSAILFAFKLNKLSMFIIARYTPFLSAGIVFALIKNKGWNVFRTILILLSLFFAFVVLNKEVNKFINHEYKIFFSHTVVYAFVTVNFLIIGLIASDIINVKTKNSKYIVTLSLATYPMYLLHQYIGFMLFIKFHTLANKYLLLTLVISFILSLSLLIVKYIEPIITKYMDKIFYGFIYKNR